MTLLTALLYMGGVLIALMLLFVLRQYYALWLGPYSKIATFPVHPIFGHVLQMARTNTELWKQWLSWGQQHARDGLYTFWLLDKPIVNVFNPNYLETLLGSADPALLFKDDSYQLLSSWLGEGLLTSFPQKWFGRRKLLTPSFHFNILQEFMPIFNEFADELANKFEQVGCGQPADVFPYVKHCALSIITETAMGKRIDEHNPADSKYIQSIEKVLRMSMLRFRRPWFKFDFIYNTFGDGKLFNQLVSDLHQYTISIIEQRMLTHKHVANLPATPFPRRLAFLDTLLTATTSGGRPLTIDDIREEVDTFMFEGHDTVSSGISWTLFLMALHQDEQKKVQAELDEIFGSSTRAATTDDLRLMKYLESVMKESMRIYPPVPLIGRQLARDVSLDNGKYVLPNGAHIFIYPYIVHRDPAVYPDPERFLPERFSEKNCLSRHPYAYIPFSAGPRNCIGQKFAIMEMKIVLSTIMRRFTLTTRLTAADVPPSTDSVTRTEKPMLIKFKVRDL